MELPIIEELRELCGATLLWNEKLTYVQCRFVDIEEGENRNKFDKIETDDKFGIQNQGYNGMYQSLNIACIQYCFVYGTSYFS